MGFDGVNNHTIYLKNDEPNEKDNIYSQSLPFNEFYLRY